MISTPILLALILTLLALILWRLWLTRLIRRSCQSYCAEAEKKLEEDMAKAPSGAFQSARSGSDSYFLGNGGTERHKIIDGQQRLVTLQLLLLGLAHEIKDSEKEEELLSYVRSKQKMYLQARKKRTGGSPWRALSEIL
jgi:hypothetical protein